VFLGQVPGVVKLTILEDDVPHLLSIGLLEHTGAIIDTGANEIQFKNINASAQMERLESGHRILDVVKGTTAFQPPKEVLEKFGLEPEDFQLSEPSCDAAYMSSQSAGETLFSSPHFKVTFGKTSVHSGPKSVPRNIPGKSIFG
jgi:hypothetical protein